MKERLVFSSGLLFVAIISSQLLCCQSGVVERTELESATTCQGDSDCQDDQGCFHSRCVDVCHGGICGQNAICFVRSHRPLCRCIEAHQGDPYVVCKRDESAGNVTISCQSEEQCPMDKTCEGETCQDLCTADTCGENAFCWTKRHNLICSCNEGHRGDPWVRCDKHESAVNVTISCQSDDQCPLDKICEGETCQDLCTVDTCGENASCWTKHHNLICTCNDGYRGDGGVGCEKLPSAEDSCHLSDDCPMDKICEEGACQDPCLVDPCGPKALCTPRDHLPHCQCVAGHTGNPYIECKRLETNCQVDADCPPGDLCKSQTCQKDACSTEVCGINAICVQPGDKALCQCEEGDLGDPYVACSKGNTSAPAFVTQEVKAEDDVIDDDDEAGPLFDLAAFLRNQNKDSDLATDEFANTINDFTQDFFAKILPAGHTSNKVFSPFSLHVALAMLTSGASDDSETQAELLNALGRTRNIQALEERYQTLLDEYQTLDNTFLFGNRLWTTPAKFDLIESEYVRRLEEFYHSDFGLLDSNNQSTSSAEVVNSWVREKTRGKIQKLFDDLSPDLVLLLTNVIYFKDAWTIPFESVTGTGSGRTGSDVVFHLASSSASSPARNAGQTTVTPAQGLKMMHRSSNEFGLKRFRFEGLPSVEFTTVSLPYKYDFGDRFEMLLVMPSDRPDDIHVFLDYLRRQQRTSANGGTSENVFDRLDREMADPEARQNEIDLTMPEFKVAGDVAVGPVLKELGVQGIFTRGEFDRISRASRLQVGQIKHKAIIEVDKEGTVGAAATGIELVPLSGAFIEPEKVTINKPFVFVIRDKKKKVPLFVGAVMDPTEEV